jgi:hypothetical protein
MMSMLCKWQNACDYIGKHAYGFTSFALQVVSPSSWYRATRSQLAKLQSLLMQFLVFFLVTTFAQASYLLRTQFFAPTP